MCCHRAPCCGIIDSVACRITDCEVKWQIPVNWLFCLRQWCFRVRPKHRNCSLNLFQEEKSHV
jgi:hypothetical protein